MKKIKLIKKKGIVFWITGLSGSGKTIISRLILPKIRKKYGPTIIFHGDELRKIFKFNNFSRAGRIQNGLKYSSLLNKISKQGINIIFSVIGMFEKIRNKNRKEIKNYLEIYIDTNINKILKKTKKKHYKIKKNVVGIDIRPELPRNPNIRIKNDLKTSPHLIADKLFKKIEKILV